MAKRVVDWQEYCGLTDQEKLKVKVINFTGVADDVVLDSEPSPQGRQARGTLRAGQGGEEGTGEARSSS